MVFYLWCWFNNAASSEEKEYEESDLYVYSANLETIHCVNVAHGKWGSLVTAFQFQACGGYQKVIKRDF